MSTRGLFYVAYAVICGTLVGLWVAHQIHHTTVHTLHDVCAVYTCSDTDK